MEITIEYIDIGGESTIVGTTPPRSEVRSVVFDTNVSIMPISTY
jgi:hypothetical protein